MNLFGMQLDLFGNNADAPKEPAKPKVPASVSLNGLR